MLEFLEAIQHREQSEIHRPHVQRSNLRLEGRSRAPPLLLCHRRSAACRDVHDRLARLLDARQEGRERFRTLVGLAAHYIASVQMDDGSTASAAPIAASAISDGVTGKYGDIDGV